MFCNSERRQGVTWSVWQARVWMGMQRFVLICLMMLASNTGIAEPSSDAQGATSGDASLAGPGASPNPAAIADPSLWKIDWNGNVFKQIDELVASAKDLPYEQLAALLNRKRVSTDEERRAVLVAIGADVPDAKGNFVAPKREERKTEEQNDKFDWLAELQKQYQDTPATRDVILDISLIRGLGMTARWQAASQILKFAFTVDGLIYRDESGRTLRRMAPHSLPGLIRASEKKGDGELARYANYQLERLDRQMPRKALSDAPDDTLKVEILQAFAASLYREAVFVVLDTIDDPSPMVRKAAREAWLEYATGRAPKPAPKEKLQLPGGKLAEKPTPLYLTSRELADIAARRRLFELHGVEPDRKLNLAELSKQLFEFYDTRRAHALQARFQDANQMLQAGKLAEATKAFDSILAQSPQFAEKKLMAAGYGKAGQALLDQGDFAGAAGLFGKAYAVAPQDEHAKEMLALHHVARGKLALQQGKTGASDFALAKKINAEIPRGSSSYLWMLFACIGAGALAFIFLIVGWSKQRA